MNRLIVLLLLACLPPAWAAAPAPALRLSQAWLARPALTAYLDLRDAKGLPLAAPEAARPPWPETPPHPPPPPAQSPPQSRCPAHRSA